MNSWLDDNQNWAFPRLQLVKVTGFTGVKAEVDFIKFLLLSSPALQELQILVSIILLEHAIHTHIQFVLKIIVNSTLITCSLKNCISIFF